jgi:hypothetical protein
VPKGNVDVDTEAIPVEVFTTADATTVPLLMKLTAPVGLLDVTAEVTVAVSTTLVPGGTAAALLMLLVKLVAVGASVTTMVCELPALAAKFVSPLYVASILLLPAGRPVITADAPPLARLTV